MVSQQRIVLPFASCEEIKKVKKNSNFFDKIKQALFMFSPKLFG